MSPADDYSSRLADREARLAGLELRQVRIGTLRLLLAAIEIAVAWLALYAHRLSPLWLIVPAAVFTGAVAYHSVLKRRHSRAARAAAFYRGGLARIQDRWAGRGSGGERFEDIHHVYAADLDLFGKGSLFELICAARTRMGEETLARWLLRPAAQGEIRERHACIADLRERLDLREDIACLDDKPQAGVQQDALLAWAESPNILVQPWLRWAPAALPALFVAAALVWALVDAWIPLVVVLLIEAAVLYRIRARLDQVLDPAERAFDDLATFAGLLQRIERERFASPPMRALVIALASGGRSASSSIARLSTIAQLAGSRDNLAVRWFFAVPFLYALQVGLAAERWRRAHGTAVRAWVDAAGRFEALSSLAQYGFERPDDRFPELVEGEACFRADGIAHPLIAVAQCVRNDVDLSGRTRVLLVSGSNMSGKCTLLRAVGLNTVLAMAGAPVRAHSLRLTPLQVGASIRVNDSLREGSSRFYAEITRLRQLNDLAEEGLPLLFLLDEMLQGTNSKDRRIGAEGVLRSFIERGAIGLASTHDLALTELRGLEEGALRNVHFEDAIVDGRMQFDFRLRDGVVTQSNGIELMRAIGLRV
jgi:hypothetical protein